MKPFEFSGTPKIIFGCGESVRTARLASAFGRNVLLVTGKSSARSGSFYKKICDSLTGMSISFSEYEIPHEPSPELIDNAVNRFSGSHIDCIIAIGGGSVIDGGKAISAMLPCASPVTDYLEVVGKSRPDGRKIPFIAIPTTAGTGSEATSNAVISKTGVNGFKRSLRHANYIPDVAIVDPELSLTCPPEITAACGMDALTQLIESYVSVKASPFTDSMAEKAIVLAGRHLASAVHNGRTDIAAREAMAYASMISGIALANAGLGVVHGLASVIGAAFTVPHGVVCGTLLAPSTRKTIERLASQNTESHALHKYASVYRLLTGSNCPDTITACEALSDYLEKLTVSLSIKPLSAYGITEKHFNSFLCENCNKNNPVQLSDSEIISVLKSRVS